MARVPNIDRIDQDGMGIAEISQIQNRSRHQGIAPGSHPDDSAPSMN
jgi:hypothetical protein